MATALLAVQFPITLYSPDVSFHAAKLLRATSGEFFVDPFTGTPTLYPTLFHLCFGLLNRALRLQAHELISLITVVNFAGLFAGFYYFVRPFFANAELASLCVLALALVFPAPTGHYILLAQPSNFSFVFLFAGFGALYRYLLSSKVVYLVAGGLLTSLAVNIWWSNVLGAASVLLVLAYFKIARDGMPRYSHIGLLLLALFLPALFTLWHVYSIREIVPNYFAGISEGDGRAWNEVSKAVSNWLISLLTKGNLPFFHHFVFWDLSQAPYSTRGFLSDGIKAAYAVASIVHYFILVLPFNLFLLFYVLWAGTGKRKSFFTVDLATVRTLATAGIAVAVVSIFAYWALGHLRRVQFVGYALFLTFFLATAAMLFSAAKLKKLFTAVCAASVFAIFYTAVYSPVLLGRGVSRHDMEVSRLVANTVNPNEDRVFVLDESRRRLAPFVRFQSFMDRREGRYYWQDPITASKQYTQFLTIKEKRPEWSKIVRDTQTRLFIFRRSAPEDMATYVKYQKAGPAIFTNRDWVVLRPSVAATRR